MKRAKRERSPERRLRRFARNLLWYIGPEVLRRVKESYEAEQCLTTSNHPAAPAVAATPYP
jgi:hypothetical protein